MSSIAVLVVLEADDPRLFPGQRGLAEIIAQRQAVVDALPTLTRVVACLSEPEAWFMLLAYQTALASFGLRMADPPDGYVAPVDRPH